MAKVFATSRRTRISLLHATFRAGSAAVATRSHWLDLASSPDNVEHVFAFNEDDEISRNTREIATSGLSLPAMPQLVSAVRNWNAAAASCTGDVLMVIADDLRPSSPGWDDQLFQVLQKLDPQRSAFVVKVRDTTDPSDTLMRHPVLSRRYYEKYGLFHIAYRGIGADNDFTFTAHSRGLVLDGRSIHLTHVHPTEGAVPTDSHAAMTNQPELKYGKQLLLARWPRWTRRLHFSYAHPWCRSRRLGRMGTLGRVTVAWLGTLRSPAVFVWRAIQDAAQAPRPQDRH